MKIGPADPKDSKRIGNRIATKAAENQLIVVGKGMKLGWTIYAIYSQTIGPNDIPNPIIQINNPTIIIIFPSSESRK